MKKIFIRITLSIFLFQFFIPLTVFGAATAPCYLDNPGFDQAAEFDGVPTYDYGPNGLLRFHFVVEPGGLLFSNLFLFMYDSECNFFGGYNYTRPHNNSIPDGIRHLEARVMEPSPGSFHFDFFNEDTGEPVDVGPAPFHQGSLFNANAVIQIRFVTQQGYNITSYLSTPAAPVKDLNFGEQKIPVLIVPGVLGTEIIKNEDKLWPNVPQMLLGFRDQFMDPMQFNENLKPLDFSVEEGSVVFSETGFDYTESLINQFIAQGYTENQDLFTFPYDWRFGVNDGNVNALKDKIQEIRSLTGSSKVDVIAHSTGGLLVKKYVIENEDHGIGKAVFVGVPNTGAPKAIKVLLQGDNFDVLGLNDEEMKKISKNMPVVYDLSPSEKYYSTKGSYYKIIEENLLNINTSERLLTFNEATSELVNVKGMNAQALSNAHNLHTQEFDQFDLRTKGVDLYNIVGCKSDSIGQVVEKRKIEFFGNETIYYEKPETTLGDGTVPLESATHLPVDSGKKYYALKSDHGKMLSQDGIRQQIVNLISDSNLEVESNLVTQDISQCKLKQKAVSIYSPVDPEVTDEEGNRLGFSPDGSLQNDIPNAGFYAFGERKFLFLPDEPEKSYTFKLKGTGEGEFTLKVQDLYEDTLGAEDGNMVVFSNIPVGTQSQGELLLSEDPKINYDQEGDGIFESVISPTSVLNPSQSQDLFSSTTQAVLTGTQGSPSFYRSDVNVSFEATDEIPGQDPSQVSGVLETLFSLNGSDFQEATTTLVTSEGAHTLDFYSVDKAGNKEIVKQVKFTIDKTAPEVQIQFKPSAKDLEFNGLDNISTTSAVTVLDSDNVVTLEDEAGNITKLEFKEKGRKVRLKAELKSISYNNNPPIQLSNRMSFFWLYQKQDLKLLSQFIKSKKDFNILSVYVNNKTTLVGKDQNGKIKKTLPGLSLLKVTTDKGELNWSY